MKKNSPSEIINALGGTAETARICGIKPGSVSEWRRVGIPPARLMYLKLLRPDLFADPETEEQKAA
jgi:hypothetical protein